ncbi:MAG: potassium uptake system protein [Peptococcaceae bacterium BICA1-7]|nr:MAG: potassium uptake system protein [Peptococcaceae bacterium BICA1-7]HBV99310.1 TrkA family potassium uptake protein [Desulfotomaculum sp.]
MKKQFAVIGLGQFGVSLIEELTNIGHEVLAIDSNEDRVNDVVNLATHAVQADAMDEQALKSLGVNNFDTVIVSIGEDMQSSILATILLKEMGVEKVVAKAKNHLHGKVLEKLGASVIFPERDMGRRLAHLLVSEGILDQIYLSRDHSIMEIKAPARFVGKNLVEVDVRRKYKVTILAIKRGEEIVVSPRAEEIIDGEDILVAVGKNINLQKLYNTEK